MNGYRTLFITFLGALSLTSTVYGTDQVRVEVSSDAEPAYTPSYFSRQPVNLNVGVQFGRGCRAINAVLVQVASRMQVEMDSRPLIECPHRDATRSASTLLFDAPEVVRTTDFEWQFMACSEDCEVVSTLPFTVFPEDLLEPVASWAKANVLRVLDPGGVLSGFLELQDIEYIGMALPIPTDAQVVTLSVLPMGEEINEQLLQQAIEHGSLVVFREAPSGLPVIIDKPGAKRRVIDVRLPLLRRLSDDAGAQNTFLQIFQMTTPGTFTE